VGFISRRSAFLSLLSELDRRDVIPMGQINHEYDKRLSRIYRQNIHLIAIIAQSFAVKPIFVPEIWNYYQLTGNSSTTIVPYVIDSDIKDISSRMNTDLEVAAKETGSLYLAELAKDRFLRFCAFLHLQVRKNSLVRSLLASRPSASSTVRRYEPRLKRAAPMRA